MEKPHLVFVLMVLGLAGCAEKPLRSTTSPGSIAPVVVSALRPADASPNERQTVQNWEDDDANLTKLVRDRLVSPGDLPVSKIQIHVDQRTVTLLGEVDNFVQRRRIERLASQTPGVEHVNDQLTVAAARRSDADIQRDVESSLKADPAFTGSQIEVRVQNGVVTLTGLADPWQLKDLATDHVEAVAGVRGIHNDLRFVPTRGAEQSGSS